MAALGAAVCRSVSAPTKIRLPLVSLPSFPTEEMPQEKRFTPVMSSRITSALLGLVLPSILTAACGDPPSDRLKVLPAPSGPLALGTVELFWVDMSREEVTTPEPTDRRELVAQLWYPTESADGAKSPYVPAVLRPSLQRVFGDSLAARAEGLDPDAIVGALPSGSTARHPLVVFLPGSGMSRHLYTALVQDLASRGFVVALLDFPGAGHTVLSGDRVVAPFSGWQRPEDLSDADDIDRFFDPMNAYLTDDVSALLSHLDELDGRADWLLGGYLDFESVGVVGHSLGGLVAFRACATDARIRACANLDGVSNYRERQNGLTKPSMLIRAGVGRANWFADLLTEPLRHDHSTGYDVLIEKATHESFSDLPFLHPEEYDADSSADVIHDIVSEHIVWFFNQTLRSQHHARPATPAEVSVTEYGG